MRQIKFLIFFIVIICFLIAAKNILYEKEIGVSRNKGAVETTVNRSKLNVKRSKYLGLEESNNTDTAYAIDTSPLRQNVDFPQRENSLEDLIIHQDKKDELNNEKTSEGSSKSGNDPSGILVKDFMSEMSFLMDSRWRGVANYHGRKISFNFWFFKNRYSFKGLSVELISWLIQEKKIVQKLDFLTVKNVSPSFLNLGMLKRIKLSDDKSTFVLYGENCPLFTGSKKSKLNFSVITTQRILMRLHCSINGKWEKVISVMLDAR